MRNLKSFNYYFCLGMIILLSSCSSTSKLSEIKDKDGKVTAHHVSYDASRRGSIIFKGKDNNTIMLSEPPPDIATKLATDLGAKVNVTNQVDASLYMSTAKEIASLGKRTASVNMLRDALYKLSEMRMAGNIDIDTKDLFCEILGAIKEMHALEMEAEKTAQKAEETKQKEAETKKVEAQTEQYLLKNNFSDNEELGAKRNYQIAIQKIFDEDIDDAKHYFEALYKKYPVHFNIDEINKELKKYNGKISSEERKKIYDFLLKNPWGIDVSIINKLKK